MRKVLGAARLREEAGESRRLQHGYFTQAAPEALDEGKPPRDRDGCITLRELDNWLDPRVKEMSDGRQIAVSGKPPTIRAAKVQLTRP